MTSSSISLSVLYAMQQYDLAPIGIPVTVDIEGTLTILHASPGNPAVFLFDEHHTDPPTLLQNQQNGDEIVAKVNVTLIGVESHLVQVSPPAAAFNIQPAFANHFHAAGRNVCGVENEALCNGTEDDINNGWWPVGGEATHPNTYLRSLFFVVTLFRMRREQGLADHLILNAGRNHIDHIADMILHGEIDHLAGMACSYVRIRATAYPGP